VPERLIGAFLALVTGRTALAGVLAADLGGSVEGVTLIACITLGAVITDRASLSTGRAVVGQLLPESTLSTIGLVDTLEGGLVDPLWWAGLLAGLTGLELGLVHDVGTGKATVVTVATDFPRGFDILIIGSFFDMEITFGGVRVIATVHTGKVLLMSTQVGGIGIFAFGTLFWSSEAGQTVPSTVAAGIILQLPELSFGTDSSRHTCLSGGVEPMGIEAAVTLGGYVGDIVTFSAA